MLKPLVSIIIPTYNRAHLIEDTLDSVMAQTYQNWECIVVDDGSTDNTEHILELYLSKDNRFKFYKRPNTHAAGGNGARNYGFKVCKGDFVQWFDSDDIMYVNYLNDRLEIFRTYIDTDVVFCAFTYFDSNGLRNRIKNKTFSGYIINDLVANRISFGPQAYLIKKEIIVELAFDEMLYRAQDLDFFFKLFTSQNSIKLRHVKSILYKIRKHDNSITSVDDLKGLKLNSKFVVYKRLLDYFFLKQDHIAVLKYKRECLVHLKRLLDNGNYKLVFANILRFKYISLSHRMFLLFCTFTQSIIGKGANQFKQLKIK